ncbi:MAG: hypothetical protein ACYS0E_21955 [Planctomycetota bacterium]|jgi:hypothetical protein
MNRFASLLLVLSFVACDKGGGSSSSTPDTAPVDQQPSKPEVSVPKAPTTIPTQYVDTFKKNWSKIEELGATFTTQFKKAQESRGRDKEAVDAANATYQELADLWAEVGYAAQDESDEIQEAWAKYLRSYERQVKKWVTMNKGLKEFSRVK